MFSLRAAHSLPLVAVVVAKQFPHLELNLTELVLLLDGADVVTVGDQHQTAIHNLDGECAPNLKRYTAQRLTAVAGQKAHRGNIAKQAKSAYRCFKFADVGETGQNGYLTS
ncbi:hypothetical protein WDV76_07160 [Xenorhabdus griffiniae]|uniref:hypothetical protein n=1 Tax=Xenorhabdus griffiniae TaxID=351672 RepID=UPI0030CF068A